jgi:hypothetical protein
MKRFIIIQKLIQDFSLPQLQLFLIWKDKPKTSLTVLRPVMYKQQKKLEDRYSFLSSFEECSVLTSEVASGTSFSKGIGGISGNVILL